MPEKTGQFRWIVKLARFAMFAALGFLALALVATGAKTVIAVTEAEHWFDTAPWVLLIVAELVAVVVTFVLFGLVRAQVSIEFAQANAASRLSRVESVLQSQCESARKLIELASLSDQAKSLLFREHELDAFREAIHEDLMRQDYETAEMLIESIEKNFGYADEAGRLRDEVATSRKATFEEKIDAAVARIQTFIDLHDWARATRESQRVIRLFPDNPKIAALPERIESARATHKRDVLQRYGEAVRKNDVNESIVLLKELDLYLTPQEAAALQESARGVFKARLHQLGVQFAIRVTEKQWMEAIAAGEQIIREFPNSRMAQEVREKMDVLRGYGEAAAQAEAEAGRAPTPSG